MEKRELVIIGAGPAGMTAAIYGRRSGLDVLLLEKGATGGQINITDEIENWPGVQHATGPELGNMFREHALKFNTEIRIADVKKVELRDGKKIVVTDKGDIEAEAIVVATGAHFRRLGCEGEAEHIGQGVSFCAVCDGAFYEGEEVAVVGGGNTAVEEGVYLTKFASKVYIIHHRDEFRANRAAIEHAMSNPKIVPVWNSVVEKIEGDGVVENLVLKNVKTRGLPVTRTYPSRLMDASQRIELPFSTPDNHTTCAWQGWQTIGECKAGHLPRCIPHTSHGTHAARAEPEGQGDVQ